MRLHGDREAPPRIVRHDLTLGDEVEQFPSSEIDRDELEVIPIA